MSFVIRTLSDTWFKELPLEKAALEPWRIPSDKSLAERSAVVDERNKILFTELISAGYEQRDGYRHFVLAAGLDLYLFYSDAGKVKFMQQESARNYPRLSSRPPLSVQSALQLANQAYSTLIQSMQQPTRCILDSNGLPFKTN